MSDSPLIGWQGGRGRSLATHPNPPHPTRHLTFNYFREELGGNVRPLGPSDRFDDLYERQRAGKCLLTWRGKGSEKEGKEMSEIGIGTGEERRGSAKARRWDEGLKDAVCGVGSCHISFLST